MVVMAGDKHDFSWQFQTRPYVLMAEKVSNAIQA